jgi:hypothetical protein
MLSRTIKKNSKKYKINKRKSIKNKRKSQKNKRISQKNKRKSQKNKRIMKKGGTNNENVTCSMCEKDVNKKDTLIPRVCLNEYGKKAHRICSECWWNPNTGFAREGIKHGCPGCEKKLPLTKVTYIPSSSQPVKVIDLTED